MSHFAVLVLHEEDQPIAELLAPYDENIEVHFKERFIDTAEFDWVATIVDCHI